MYYQKLELVLLIVQLAMLAGVLSVIGLAVRKLIYAYADSRQQARMREQMVVASARARTPRVAKVAR